MTRSNAPHDRTSQLDENLRELLLRY